MEFVVRQQPRRLGLVLGALLMLGCGEDATGPRPVPTSMTVAGGEGQRGTVGEALDSGLTVFVADKFGQPVPGVLVRFAVAHRSGSLDPLTQTTGPSGHALARWTLPTTAGPHIATARASGLDSIDFHAVAAAALPASLSLVSGDLQTSAPAGATPVVVQVRDRFGNPVAGVPVSFVPSATHASVAPATVRSDSLGQASTNWTLGDEPGRQALAVRVDTLQLRVKAPPLIGPVQLGVGAVLFPGTRIWAPVQSEATARDSAVQWHAVGPVPALRCWQNALGATPLEPSADLLPGCEDSPGRLDAL